ncbi:group II truncated hemoglobin [uncultured Paracoccus sp.]|uniref:group II truncated hemoglobin n=1 Tax=uncultured Paracoccus sp. TaxID=189685 RepID=UPI002613E94D|nr:group II truncated hemoglobin [uncultured Paracoccus sp.]
MSGQMIDRIGGEPALRHLVEDFYDLIETLPEGESLRRLHLRGHGLAHVRQEQFNFLSGFLGGRRYYLEQHLHMDLRRMHGHIPIRAQDAEDWLACMDKALARNGLSGPEIDRLRDRFRKICLMLVNDLQDWGMHPGTEISTPSTTGTVRE